MPKTATIVSYFLGWRFLRLWRLCHPLLQRGNYPLLCRCIHLYFSFQTVLQPIFLYLQIVPRL